MVRQPKIWIRIAAAKIRMLPKTGADGASFTRGMADRANQRTSSSLADKSSA